MKKKTIKISEVMAGRFAVFAVIHIVLSVEVLWPVVGVSGRWILAFKLWLVLFPPLFFLQTIIEIRNLEDKRKV